MLVPGFEEALPHIAKASEIEINLRGNFAPRVAGDQGEIAHTGDAGQSFATETKRADADDVAHSLDLAGGVAFKRQQGVVGTHTYAVVAHLDHVFAAIIHRHRDLRGAGVDSIFHQFLDHRGRPFDDLAGGNLVAHIVGQNVDYVHVQYLKMEPLVNSRMREL